MTNTVLPAAYQRTTSQGQRIKTLLSPAFSFLQNRCQPTNSTATSVFPASQQIAVAVTVSVDDDVMNSTATRLFPVPRILHPLVLIRPQGGFIQGNGQGNFLRILCAAPTTTSPDLRGILFSTGQTLRQWRSHSPGFSTSTTQTNCFP